MNAIDLHPQEQEIEAFLAKGVNLPPQPKVLMDIDALAAKDDVSIREIAALVGKDAGLTARIFKVVHSPFFGIRTEIDSLDRAITMVGLKPALAIIKSAALRAIPSAAIPRPWTSFGTAPMTSPCWPPSSPRNSAMCCASPPSMPIWPGCSTIAACPF